MPKHEDALMTIAQQPEQEGFDKDIAQGEQRVIQKGKLEVVRTMLQKGPTASP